MKTLILDGQKLTINDLIEYALAKEVRIELCPKSKDKILDSRKYVLDLVSKNKTTYGINTGFGALSNKSIQQSNLKELQYNLIRSHCTGVGDPFSRTLSRAIMILRTNCLVSGYSGVSLEIIQLLIELINNDVYPYIPCRGSVGASGDLAPLAHLALALIGEGELFYNGKFLKADFVLSQLNLKPVELGPKDGLALINGTSVLTAIAAYAAYETAIIAKAADIIGAATVDALRGSQRAFNPLISSLKPHQGQIAVSHNLTTLLKDSGIMNSHLDCDRVQDPYSLRCMPQVHGASRQALNHAQSVIQTELNSVTDNPLIFSSLDEVLSGGNFHGQAVSMVMDYLCMGLNEYCSMSERRIEKLMNPSFSTLPAFLTPDSGLNSGFMIAHVTAAALASEVRTFCHPASVDNIPTSTDKEDHVSMGVGAGLKLLQVVSNTRKVLSIELLCSLQGIDFLRPLKSSPPLENVYNLIRVHVPFLKKDMVLNKFFTIIEDLISNGEIIKVAESEAGELL